LASWNEGNQIVWLKNLEDALEKAASEDKLVLLYFSGSDWCRPCIQLKEKVFDSDEFGKYSSNNFITVQIDFPAHSKNRLSAEQQAYNEQIAESYNSSGAFPFIVIMNKEGKILGELNGYNRETTGGYIKKLKTVIDNYK